MEKNDKIEKLAIILSKIHGHCLLPFYKYDCDDDYRWETLEENTKDKGLVDKALFRNMAKFIIRELE